MKRVQGRPRVGLRRPRRLRRWWRRAIAAACRHPLPRSRRPANPAPRPSALLPSPPSPAPRPPRSCGLTALQHDIDAILAAPALARGYWGVLVKSLETDDTLYALQRAQADDAGVEHEDRDAGRGRRETRLGLSLRHAARRRRRRSHDGALEGDLIVVGTGDPSLTRRDGAPSVFATWAEPLKQQGITRDRRARRSATTAPSSGESLGHGMDVGRSARRLRGRRRRAAVQREHGCASRSRRGRGRRLARTSPSRRRRAGSIVAQPGDDRRRRERRRRSRCTACRAARALELRGSVPLGRPPASRAVSVDNPTLFFVSALRAALIADGIDVRGAAVDIDDVTDAPALQTARTLDRLSIAAALDARDPADEGSQNQYAETLLKTLGAAPGSPTAENGADDRRGDPGGLGRRRPAD